MHGTVEQHTTSAPYFSEPFRRPLTFFFGTASSVASASDGMSAVTRCHPSAAAAPAAPMLVPLGHQPLPVDARDKVEKLLLLLLHCCKAAGPQASACSPCRAALKAAMARCEIDAHCCVQAGRLHDDRNSGLDNGLASSVAFTGKP